MKLIIIDDHKPSRDALAKYAKHYWKGDPEPLEVIECETMAEGLMATANLADYAEASIIVLDLSLPDSSENDTIEKIIPILPPPVIVLTGNISDEVVIRCRKAGADQVFHKGTAVELIMPTIFGGLIKDVIRKAKERKLGHAQH